MVVTRGGLGRWVATGVSYEGAIIPGPKPVGTFPPSLPAGAAPLPLFRALRNKPFAIRAARDI